MKATYIDHMGTDLSVVNAARVSFGKNSEWENQEAVDIASEHNLHAKGKLNERDTKLIYYLADHGHHSPFNHTYISMHMKAPIFVARQLQKHEYMPWNEISRRYVDTDPEFYTPKKWRGKAKDKKQGSEGVVNRVWRNELSIWGEPVNEVSVVEETVYELYLDLIDSGVAPEQARMVLPQNTYTEWYWSGTLHAWAKMYNLRTSPDAQQETQEVVLQCGEILSDLYPVSFEALVGSQ